MDQAFFSTEQLADLARWLKVIAEPSRLLLLEKIIEGVQCNCELGGALRMAPNLISHHLGVLREAGLVEIERDPVDARWVYYSINQKKMNELKQLFDAFVDPTRMKPRRNLCNPQVLADSPLGVLKLDE